MKLRFLKISLLSIVYLGFANSCSTGEDPEDIILDVFSVPLEACLQIQNIFNDLAMDVNGIVMNNLLFEKDTITKDVATCLDALVFRNKETSKLDSIVLDYGSSSCKSNGGSFKGMIIVEPKDTSLELFDIRLKDFSSQGYDISSGAIDFQATGDAGKDFLITLENAKFSIDTVHAFSISSISSEYTFVDDEEDDKDYVDDIFEFTISLTGETPDAIPFSFDSSEGKLIYTFSCGEIIGGDAFFELTDIGNGNVDFGGGDPEEDCDDDVTIQAKEVTIKIEL